MKKKYQYGRGLPDILKYGMVLSVITSKIRDLNVPIDQALMIHNLIESLSLSDEKANKKLIEDNLQSLRSQLSPRLTEINKNIDTINKLIKNLDFSYDVPKLEIAKILAIVKLRLQTLYKVENAQDISNEHFHLKLNQMLQKPTTAILEFVKATGLEQYTDDMKGLGEAYREGITQAMHICSIGYYSTSVFIAGKTMEELINAYFEVLFKLKMFEKFDVTKKKFDDKIGILYGGKYLDENEYHSLSGVRIDRNTFAHPSVKLLTKKQAHLKIRVIAELIPPIEKKITRLSRKLNS